jgi:t-SNARE complex subunit (syntaxin)
MAEDKISEDVMTVLLPRLKEFSKNLVGGELEAALQAALPAIETGMWDKMVAEIGQKLNLPQETVTRLQQIDDEIAAMGSSMQEIKNKSEELVGNLFDRLESVREKVAEINLDKIMLITYAELKEERKKAAESYGVICLIIGVLAGIFLGITVIAPMLGL